MDQILSKISRQLLYDPAAPMLFNTGLFLVLFVVFLLVFQSLRNKPTAKMILTILFSLYFYYKSSGWCVLILLGVCIFDYFLALWLAKKEKPSKRKLAVVANVTVNIAMLVWFKYFNLLADAFASIVSTSFEPWNIILPAGISFFTFRSISYIVDIYRRELNPCRSLLDYTFFLTFFPPLLAGPVVRAKDMLPQVEKRPLSTRGMSSEGLFLIMVGLVKKVVIADYISANFVDRIFDNPLLYSGFENLMGCVGFSIQLYCDFSGYSDMAIGLALMLGYRFKENFSAPFKSQSPTEFWRRWHISLSTWLRDYLYIPLGGNRKGRARAYLNQFITMVLGGLWHGASWMYLIWGAYHGFLLAMHKMLKIVVKIPEAVASRPEIKAFNILLTFTLVVVGFTFFRAPSLNTVSEIFTQIFHNFHGGVALAFIEAYLLIVLAMIAGMAAHMSPKSWSQGVLGIYSGLSATWQAVILAAVVFAIIQIRQTDLVPFVYLQY